MVIDVYSGFSKKPNSTKQPSTPRATLTVRLKEACSVLRPVFLVNQYNLSDNYVKWGSRYYYIEDIVIIGNELAEYHCSTDVLATFKSVIGGSSQYVLRAANEYSPSIPDGRYPVRSNAVMDRTILSTLAFSSVKGGTYVLGVISSTTSGNAVTYYTMGETNFRQLMTALFDDSYLNASDISTELQKELVNPMQYITSCMWYPFDVYGDMESIKFGWWDSQVLGGRLPETANARNAQRIFSVEQTFTLPMHPQAASRGTYLNDAPYTRRTLNCYGFGSIPINPSPFAGSDAGAIEIDVDCYTGVGQLYVACQGVKLFLATSQIGVPIQLNQNNANVIGGAIGMAAAIGSAAAGNVAGATVGILSSIDNLFPQVQSQGANGSKIAYLHTPEISSEFHLIADEDNTTIGRPLCKQKTISSLSGFMVCENADLDISASPSEKDQIVSYMNGGFYYE